MSQGDRNFLQDSRMPIPGKRSVSTGTDALKIVSDPGKFGVISVCNSYHRVDLTK